MTAPNTVKLKDLLEVYQGLPLNDPMRAKYEELLPKAGAAADAGQTLHGDDLRLLSEVVQHAASHIKANRQKQTNPVARLLGFK